MKALRFEGYGDDAFMERTHKVHFDNAASGKPIVFEVKALDGSGLRVWGLYASDDEPEPVVAGFPEDWPDPATLANGRRRVRT